MVGFLVRVPEAAAPGLHCRTQLKAIAVNVQCVDHHEAKSQTSDLAITIVSAQSVLTFNDVVLRCHKAACLVLQQLFVKWE